MACQEMEWLIRFIGMYMAGLVWIGLLLVGFILIGIYMILLVGFGIDLCEV